MKKTPNNGDYLAFLVYNGCRPCRVWTTSDGVRFTLHNKEK